MSYFQSPTKLATWKLNKAKFIVSIKICDSIENDAIFWGNKAETVSSL